MSGRDPAPGTKPRPNYQRELDALLKTCAEAKKKPKLLLHACCAPCSSYVLEYLARFFEIVLYYYNPNISPQAEYEKRVQEVSAFCANCLKRRTCAFWKGRMSPNAFLRSRGG